jgi:hypothetical protein
MLDAFLPPQPTMEWKAPSSGRQFCFPFISREWHKPISRLSMKTVLTCQAQRFAESKYRSSENMKWNKFERGSGNTRSRSIDIEPNCGCFSTTCSRLALSRSDEESQIGFGACARRFSSVSPFLFIIGFARRVLKTDKSDSLSSSGK